MIRDAMENETGKDKTENDGTGSDEAGGDEAATGAAWAAPGPVLPFGQSDAMPWMVEALHLLNGADGENATDKRRLLRLIERVDSTISLGPPWCGLFVGHCLQTAIPDCEDLPRLHMRGRSWLDWGEPAEPQLGAIVVMWHLHRRSPFGHVAFYWAEDDDSYHLLGGNQRDRIIVQRYNKDRLLGARWPKGFPQPRLTRREPAGAAAPFN